LRDEHLFVQAEIPTDQVSDQSLKLAITSVIDGVTRAKLISPMNLAQAPAAAAPPA